MALGKNIWILCLFIGSVHTAIYEIKDIHSLQKIKSFSTGLVVLFNPQDAPRQLVADLSKAQEQLKEYQVTVVQCDCSKVNFNDCPTYTAVRIMSNNLYHDVHAPFVEGTDAIVGQVLSLLLTGKITFLTHGDNWDKLLSNVKGKTDVVLLYASANETKVFRYFMDVAYVFSEKFHFVVSKKIVHPITKKVLNGSSFSLLYYKCKDSWTGESGCEYIKHSKPITSLVDMLVFVIGQSYPRISHMDAQGMTPLDKEKGISIPMKIVYFITDRAGNESATRIVKELASSQMEFYFVIVDKDQHRDILYPRFGVLKDESFPALSIELNHIDGTQQKYVENWPPDLEFTFEYIKDLLMAIERNMQGFFKNVADQYDLQVISSKEKQNVDERTIVASCNKSDICRKFAVNYRRAMRTIYRHNTEDYAFAFIDYSNDTANDTKLPSLKFIVSANESIVFNDDLTCEKILNFMSKSLRIEDMNPLPLSGSDITPITLSKRKNKDLDPSKNVVDDYGDNGDDYDYDYDDDDDEQLLKKQEDQVAKYMISTKKLTGQFITQKDPNVTSLTEKTFSSYLESADVTFVHFFLPWEPKSFIIHEVYSKVAGEVAVRKRFSSGTNLKMAKVNCFNWDSLCFKENITSYPTIKIYRNGFEANYMQGIVSHRNLMETVKVYEAPYVKEILSKNVLREFTTNPPRNISVLALLVSSSSKEFKSFSALAKTFDGKYTFGYITGDLVKKSRSQFNVQCPSIIIFTPHDVFRSQHVTTDFDLSHLKDFVARSVTPSFGELTYENFPVYASHGKPLVILFKRKLEKTPLTKEVEMFANIDKLSNVFFLWMDMDLAVTKAIKNFYIGNEITPALVFVDLKKVSFGLCVGSFQALIGANIFAMTFIHYRFILSRDEILRLRNNSISFFLAATLLQLLLHQGGLANFSLFCRYCHLCGFNNCPLCSRPYCVTSFASLPIVSSSQYCCCPMFS